MPVVGFNMMISLTATATATALLSFPLLKPHLNIQVSTLEENPGSANGFNFGLRTMLRLNADWVFVVNG
jgi:GT2 family glycosyltransferase